MNTKAIHRRLSELNTALLDLEERIVAEVLTASHPWEIAMLRTIADCLDRATDATGSALKEIATGGKQQ